MLKIHVSLTDPDNILSDFPKDVKARVNIFVYRTENEQLIDSYSNYNNLAYGHGSTLGQARRNALRAAAQMIPATFIKNILDNAK